MIEDPLYLDKKTKVFIIGDYTTDYDNYHAMNAKKAWERLGYTVIKQDINTLKDPDFNIKFDPSVKQGKRYYFKESYTIVGILKKMRNRDTPYIITRANSVPYSDIGRSIEKYDFFPFFNIDFKRYQQTAKVFGVYLNKYASHILYKSVIDSNEKMVGQLHMFNFLAYLAVENNMITIKDIEENLATVNAQIL